jgi:hypothetical protein
MSASLTRTRTLHTAVSVVVRSLLDMDILAIIRIGFGDGLDTAGDGLGDGLGLGTACVGWTSAVQPTRQVMFSD